MEKDDNEKIRTNFQLVIGYFIIPLIILSFIIMFNIMILLYNNYKDR